MISYLQGTIKNILDKSIILLLTNGLGLEVELNEKTLLTSKENDDISLYIYTHTKEDGTTLYGFENLTERAAFKILISVGGVGPKLAMKILSNLSLDILVEAITIGDEKILSTVSGVGKKVAERLILELKGKFDNFSNLSTNQNISFFAEAHETLVAMGYKQDEATKTLNNLKGAKANSLQELLKLALQNRK